MALVDDDVLGVTAIPTDTVALLDRGKAIGALRAWHDDVHNVQLALLDARYAVAEPVPVSAYQYPVMK